MRRNKDILKFYNKKTPQLTVSHQLRNFFDYTKSYLIVSTVFATSIPAEV